MMPAVSRLDPRHKMCTEIRIGARLRGLKTGARIFVIKFIHTVGHAADIGELFDVRGCMIRPRIEIRSGGSRCLI